MASTTIPIYTYDGVTTQLGNFLNNYELESLVTMPAHLNDRNLKQRKDRMCRYCGMRYPNTTFNTKAHLYPKLLGNRTRLSDFECDNCNTIFSTYETSLADYFGITRSIINLAQGYKIPKFKSDDGKVIAETLPESNGSKLHIKSDDTSQLKFEGNQTIFTYDKKPYIPLHIYKSLLKMAIATVKESDLPNYMLLIRYLISDGLDHLLTSFAKHVHLHKHSTVSKFHVYLFRRKSQIINLPLHNFMIYYQEYIFQVFLPSNEDINRIHTGGTITFPYSPPILAKPPFNQYGSAEILDLSSKEKVIEKGRIRTQSDPNSLYTHPNPEEAIRNYQGPLSIIVSEIKHDK